ncbi:hypothetical protein NDU88_002918 [Pleurodeles waltl]|uniref:Uncharacterized protein n=1 Tax=Pleurodeles waltl TaxID=8319 RepID=A0AAV7QDA5_PLEWA|nr:hypothetical protein NDU88_002918 [Pleurodeles waltl]
MHRCFRNRAKAQLQAATTNSGPLPSPTRRTAGQASQVFKHRGVPPRSQLTGSPLSTRALRHTDLAPNHQGREAPPVTTASRWHPEAPLTLQAPPPPGAGPRSSHQVSGGPRKAPRPSVPGALATRSTQGEGPSRGPGRASRRAAAAPQLPACTPHLPQERRNPAPTGTAAPGTPEGGSAIRGKPPGLPLAGQKSIFGPRQRSAERNVLALRHLDHAP